MQEIAHLQGALVFWDEVGQGAGQAVAAGQPQALIHMGLQDRGAGLGIIELVVGIGAIALVLDEPLGPVQLADIVIQGSRADQVHIRLDRPGPLLGQAADHQGVLKGAGSFTGEATEQGPLQVG